MTLLDRYIARQYVSNTLVLFVILFSFIVAVDVSLNVDRFSNKAEEMIRANAGAVDDAPAAEPGLVRTSLVTVILVLDLWWPRLLQLYNFMLGLVLVGAMGFTCSQLVRHREFVAVLASGQSLWRVCRPILLVALLFTALQLINQELLVPKVAPLLTREHGDVGKRTLGEQPVPLTRDASGRLWHAKSFDADTDTLYGLSVWERDEQGLPVSMTSAESARWRDGGWDLTGGVKYDRVRTAGPLGPVTRIETDLDPTTLRMKRFAGYAHSLSWRQIGQVLDRGRSVDPGLRDRLQRSRYGRISIAICNMLALVISLPFFVTRVPGNLVGRSLRCAPVAVVSLLGGVFGATAAIPGLPAALGVFVPVMILAPVAIAMVTSIKT